MVQLKDKEVDRLLNKDVAGFVSANGKKIVNGEGREILLRGVGFGSWFLPEGYMWCFPENGDRPRRVEKMIRDLIGEDKAYEFWEEYYNRYITEDDIKIIAKEGFNSVRLPINYRNYMDNGGIINRIDQVIEWCSRHEVYVILDLHGAPGGQTGTNIDDSEFDSPDLFINEHNIQLVIDFWIQIATRYKDEWIVAGYDLLNEPLPEWFSKYNDMVMPLYKKIIKAIRAVDTKHMIILEGVHWATDWSIFNEILDDNIMYQFHKYWNNPDRESLKPYLDKREELNAPIFMGEGGENNIEWYIGAFRLFEDLDISWNFWTWKKMNTTNSPFSINRPDGWDMLINYLNGGVKPDRAQSITILWKYLDNLKTGNCIYRPEISKALLRCAPITIPAAFYVNNDKGIGFDIKNSKEFSSIGFRENDGIKMGFRGGDRTTANFQHGGGESWKDDEWIHIELDNGDWVSYDFYIGQEIENRPVHFIVKTKGNNGNDLLKLELDNKSFKDYYVSNKSWSDIIGTKTFIPEAGLNRVTLYVVHGSVKIEKIKIAVQ